MYAGSGWFHGLDAVFYFLGLAIFFTGSLLWGLRRIGLR